MASVIPLKAVPSQSLSVQLGDQPCQIVVSQKMTGLFIDLYVNNVLIIGGVICLNNVLIVRDAYLGFIGDLYFNDTQGDSDPEYTGLGDRYLLLWTLDQPS